jgi:hypothetical protein
MWRTILLACVLFQLTACSGIWHAPDTVPSSEGCEAPAICAANRTQVGERG